MLVRPVPSMAHFEVWDLGAIKVIFMVCCAFAEGSTIGLGWMGTGCQVGHQQPPEARTTAALPQLGICIELP